MKRCLKGRVSPLLKQYQIDNPNATWEQFKNECQQGYKKVQKRLRQNQGNLCCYCEIETKQGLGNGKDDFRVEHFHPKADKKIPDYNWALDWQNMLGCCCGGTERYVTDSENRFIPNKNERHSDALKGEFIWDSEILNPLEIPAFPILFKANRTDGSLEVIEDNCRHAGIDVNKAHNCLHPQKLNLNSAKLNKFRKTTMDVLNQHIGLKLSQGLSIEQAMSEVSKEQLRKNKNGYCPAFFTTIRSYLGKNAEVHLQNINYFG